MRDLTRRSDGRAAADTLLWLSLLVVAGVLAHRAFGTWWAVPAFALYGTLYGSACDARWHECGHATAFRARWPNTAVYHLASLMAMREPVSWRWSHTRHHDDTIVVGRDKEIAVKRSTPLWRLGLEFVGVFSVLAELRKLRWNLVGRLDPEDADFVPESERAAAVRSGRVMVVLLLAPPAAAIAFGSAEPLLFAGVLPSMYGRWLLVVYGLTQHAGLAEDVLDHRLNTRSVRMNVVNRFLYSNMNFHVEHHMFPTVPYHRLPALHATIRDDLPPMYEGILAAYREIVPALRRQSKDPTYHVERPIPAGAVEARRGVGATTTSLAADVVLDGGWLDDGWLDVGDAGIVPPGRMRSVEVDGTAYALFHTADDRWYATDAACTHGRAPLTDGHFDGSIVECPKHNGRFDVSTGRALGAPALVDLRCHEVRLAGTRVHLRPRS